MSADLVVLAAGQEECHRCVAPRPSRDFVWWRVERYGLRYVLTLGHGPGYIADPWYGKPRTWRRKKAQRRVAQHMARHGAPVPVWCFS